MNLNIEISKLVDKFRSPANGHIGLEKLNIAVERSMYQKTHFIGSDRSDLDADVYLMVFAQQFRPFRLNLASKSVVVKQSYCAYRGLEAPLRISHATGLPDPRNSYQSNLDHIIPRSVNGEEHPFNFQMLASWYNSTNFKGGMSTFHARWHAFRKGGDIDALPFIELADLFFWVFDHYHANESLRYIIPFDLCFAWPWWARESRPPFRPILHGYDEINKCMRVSKQESYFMEFSALALNTMRYLAMTENKSCVTTVRDAYQRYYNMQPEAMAAFGRGRIS